MEFTEVIDLRVKMILPIDVETVFDLSTPCETLVSTPQFILPFFKKEHAYQIRNPVTFLNFIKVTLQGPLAT